MSRHRENEPFVGRGKELAVLVSVLDEATAGAGRIVTISGEPGIGKTRCVEELSAIAEGLDFRIAWGHSLESMGAPPYWPWIEAIQDLQRTLDDEELRGALGEGTARLAEIVPDLRNRIGDVPEIKRVDEAEAERFRLFSSLVDFLRATAEHQGLLVILEDLNWADEETLNLLEFLSARVSATKIVVIGTYRDVELSRRNPLSATLGALVRSGVYERLALHRLSDDETRSYIESALVQAIDSRKVEQIQERAEGNPLFLQETVRQLNDDPGDTSISEGIREVIGRRLDRLSESCNVLLATAAILGREFSVERLAMIDPELDATGITEMIDEAIGAGLIDANASRLGAFRFSHALVQETLIDELSITRRVQLHAQIAETFAERYGSVADFASELLHHYSNAQLILGCEPTVKYALLAGDRALEKYATVEAIRCYLIGLECIEDDPMSDAKAALYDGLGKAASASESGMRSYPEGFERRVEAFEYYLEAGQIDRALEIANYRASAIGYWNADAALKFYSRAVDLVESGTDRGIRVRCLYGRFMLESSGDSVAASPHLEQALNEARELDRVDLELFVLSNWMSGLRHVRDWETTARLIAESERIEDRAKYVDWQQVCEHIGFYNAVNRFPERNLEYQLEAHRLSKINHFRLESTANNLVMSYRMSGRFDEARALVEETPEVSSHPLIAAQIAWIELAADERERGMRRVRRLIESSEATARGPGYAPIGVYWLLFNGVICGLLDESYLDAAAHAADRVRVERTTSGSESGTLFPTRHLGAIYALQGKRNEVMDLLPLFSIEEDERRLMPENTALMLWATGRGDEAKELMLEACDRRESANLRGLLLTLYFIFLRILTEPGDPSDAAEAKRYLDRTSELVDEFGFVGLSEPIDRYRARIEEMAKQASAARGVRRSHLPAGLTPRESEVLVQLASGKSNHDIAEVLFISEKTVHTHLYNIFQKLDVKNRTEAAATAMRLGIEPASAE